MRYLKVSELSEYNRDFNGISTTDGKRDKPEKTDILYYMIVSDYNLYKRYFNGIKANFFFLSGKKM